MRRTALFVHVIYSPGRNGQESLHLSSLLYSVSVSLDLFNRLIALTENTVKYLILFHYGEGQAISADTIHIPTLWTCWWLYWLSGKSCARDSKMGGRRVQSRESRKWEVLFSGVLLILLLKRSFQAVVFDLNRNTSLKKIYIQYMNHTATQR